MRWALEAKRWSEVLRPRLWKAFAKCEGAGMHADKLGVLRTRIKKLETKWKLVCEYRNGLALAPTAKAASVDPFKTGASGRPSAASLVEAEAERRIANGEVAPREDDLAKFSRDLAALVGRKTPQVRTGRATDEAAQHRKRSCARCGERPACRTDRALARQSRSRKSAQGDKWSFCLTAGTLWPANQERP
jgi:hypothetical protein